VLCHSEKVLAHAEQQLLSQGRLNSAELLALYKKFLKIENHRIRLKHHSGAGGREICAARASLVDIVLRHLLTAALNGLGQGGAVAVGVGGKPVELAVVANGGFGRGELNPFSDVDIMFLHGGGTRTLDERVNEVVQQILYMLWDIGFKVGHSTRSIPEAVKEANSDMLSKTSLLEARLVAGDEALFERFRARFLEQCVEGHVEEYIADRVTNQSERHAKFGGSVYMQEPNIKNGCGSLRDYQNLLWISFFKKRVRSTAGLVEEKLINEAERRLLDRAYDFLLRVRTELHYLNKRSTDVIVLNQQVQLADRLRYPQKNVLRRGEAFMRDYYQHARNIFNITELISERLSVTTPKLAPKRRLLSFLRLGRGPERFDGFFAVNGLMYAESRDIFAKVPERLMRLFQYLQQRELQMSADLAQLVRRRLHLVDKTFQYSRANREVFTAICSRKGEVGRILRAMHQVDFLGRYIPEFGQLTCLVQHEFFHRYTADEHTLVCIEKLDALLDTEDPRLAEYKALFGSLEDPLVLYLALLLHDTGKASNAPAHAEASAVFAQKVARRLQLSSAQRRSLLLLVDNHILMSSTAQRRNLDDQATITEFAGLVRDVANLDALMLLSLADGQGTGDERWSDWKESLIWQLYRSTGLFLADGEGFRRQRTIEKEGLRRRVCEELPAEWAEEVEAHFEHMPERYLQSYPAGEVTAHIQHLHHFLEKRLREDGDPLLPVVQWIARPAQGHSEVWICGWDRTQLLARIAGSFACAQLNILGADAFTRGDGLVFDVFRVCDTGLQAVTDERAVQKVERLLAQSLREMDYDFTPELAGVVSRRHPMLEQELDFSTRITIDNDAHPIYTLVDILTPDRMGLLYHLLRAMGREGVQIALSRIATDKGAATDSFYVTDSEGQKIRDARGVSALQQVLREASELSVLRT